MEWLNNLQASAKTPEGQMMMSQMGKGAAGAMQDEWIDLGGGMKMKKRKTLSDALAGILGGGVAGMGQLAMMDINKAGDADKMAAQLALESAKAGYDPTAAESDLSGDTGGGGGEPTNYLLGDQAKKSLAGLAAMSSKKQNDLTGSKGDALDASASKADAKTAGTGLGYLLPEYTNNQAKIGEIEANPQGKISKFFKGDTQTPQLDALKKRQAEISPNLASLANRAGLGELAAVYGITGGGAQATAKSAGNPADVVKAFMAANPGVSAADAEAEARKLGYIN